MNEIEEGVSGPLSQGYQTEIENRIQAKLDNDNMFNGMMAIIGLFCVLLATIGIGNVFTNTFGFVRQRKREFARYMSIGMTPDGLKKIFCVEALVIAGFSPGSTVYPDFAVYSGYYRFCCPGLLYQREESAWQ